MMNRTALSDRLRILHPATNQTVGPTDDLLGLAPPGALVQLRLDKNAPHTVTADARGRWRYTPRLAPGQHNVHARLNETGGAHSTAYVTYTVRNPLD